MRKFKVVKGGLIDEENAWFGENIIIPIYIEPTIKKTIINQIQYLCFPLIGVEVVLNRNNHLILRKTRNNSSVKIFINPRMRSNFIGFVKQFVSLVRRQTPPISSYQVFITGQKKKYTVTLNTYKGE